MYTYETNCTLNPNQFNDWNPNLVFICFKPNKTQNNFLSLVSSNQFLVFDCVRTQKKTV